jgi:hypothetical protein
VVAVLISLENPVDRALVHVLETLVVSSRSYGRTMLDDSRVASKNLLETLYTDHFDKQTFALDSTVLSAAADAFLTELPAGLPLEVREKVSEKLQIVLDEQARYVAHRTGSTVKAQQLSLALLRAGLLEFLDPKHEFELQRVVELRDAYVLNPTRETLAEYLEAVDKRFEIDAPSYNVTPGRERSLQEAEKLYAELAEELQ